jgi:hypothetical protein
MQNKQTLQLFSDTIKQKVFTEVIKMPSGEAWLMRTSDLIKRGRKVQALLFEKTLIKVESFITLDTLVNVKYCTITAFKLSILS